MTVRLIVIFIISFINLCYAGADGYGDPSTGYPTMPNWEERGVITLTNACRMDPVGFKNMYVGSYNILLPQNYPAVPPVYWHLDLNRSARAHAEDMANNCGMQHNSCNGDSFYIRIYSYYSNSYTIGENIATGSADAMDVMVLWIKDGSTPAGDKSGSDGHRKNIMSASYREMGAGYAYGPVQWYTFWVQDFGGGASSYKSHPIVCGTHLFLETNKTTFMANYYDSLGRAPQTASVIINGTEQSLSLLLGTAGKGTYSFAGAKGSTCRNYYFSFRDNAGTLWRYPQNGALVTSGEGSCTAEYIPQESLSVVSPEKPGQKRAAFSVLQKGRTIQIRWADNASAPHSCEIYDINGKMLVKRNLIPLSSRNSGTCYTVSLTSAAPSGVYLLRFRFSDGTEAFTKLGFIEQ